MASILASAADPDYPAEIVLVLSNRSDAPGLALAARAGAASIVIDHRCFGRDRVGHEAAIDQALREAGAELVCLAGYMRLLTPFLVHRWAGRMLNIHPSLLPSFVGLATHQQALDTGVKVHGATVHFVTAELDHGPIVAQAVVPVLPSDDEHALADRVREAINARV